MNTIQCAIEGCTEKFQTPEPISPDTRFICRKHPREVMVTAVGREYDPELCEKDGDIHFQDFAYDDDNLNRRIHLGDDFDPNDDFVDALDRIEKQMGTRKSKDV